MTQSSEEIVTIAGGVGAAKFLRGLIEVRDPASCIAVVNIADDFVLHGLKISPDLDTVTYTLSDEVNPETGWGRKDESWVAMAELERLGGETWFGLGDRDLATHLYRTQRLGNGAQLSDVTSEICSALGISVTVLPVTNNAVATKIVLLDGSEIDFQDYFVARRHDVELSGVRFAGANTATPAPGVLDSIATAPRIVIAPSNPIVSIGPVLAVPGIGEALAARRDVVTAISPIIGGKALKGPAGRMMGELGHEVSAVGVAKLYSSFVSTLVIDNADAELASAVEATGMRCVVTDTIMSNVGRASELAGAVVEDVS